MKLFTGISKKEILDYLRLEEDEDTAELLKTASLLHVGTLVTEGVKTHYWSYPTPCSIAWVSYSSDGALSTINEADVPQVIRDGTAERDKHPMRKVSKAPDTPVDRSPIPAPIWVPNKQIPYLLYFPMYEEVFSIHQAARAFCAKTSRQDLGIDYWHVYFGVKLTSGRYAIIQAKEKRPEQIEIELEVEPTKTDYPMGFVYMNDLKEILSVLGRECRLPLKNCQYQWRE
jgi:hypothetical protein